MLLVVRLEPTDVTLGVERRPLGPAQALWDGASGTRGGDLLLEGLALGLVPLLFAPSVAWMAPAAVNAT